MFDDLSSRFESVFKKIGGRGVITEENVTDAMRDVKRALLEADVNYKVVKKFTSAVKEKALGSDVLNSVSPGQQFVKIVHDELTSLMGERVEEITFHTNRQNVIVMAGLQGSGKTTATAKLALRFRKQGHRPLMVACDIYRPAAVDQLKSLGKSLNIPVFSEEGKRPQEICSDALKLAKREDYTLVIVDTAGRLHIDEDMMSELRDVCKIASPDKIFFVADAMSGQDAVNVAKQFYDEINFSGVILSKMDGDARGGAALAIKHVTGVPVNFVGLGEKPDAFEPFHPERMASRILGMGDVVSLVEKAQQVVDLESSRKLEKKIRKNAFDLQDFLDQLQQIKKMGSIKDLLGMLPGMGAQLKDAEIDPSGMKRIEAIITSMTPKERAKPKIIDASRKRRIAGGSGTTVQEINRLLKQFDSMRGMMKRLNKISGKRGAKAAMRNIMPF